MSNAKYDTTLVKLSPGILRDVSTSYDKQSTRPRHSLPKCDSEIVAALENIRQHFSPRQNCLRLLKRIYVVRDTISGASRHTETLSRCDVRAYLFMMRLNPGILCVKCRDFRRDKPVISSVRHSRDGSCVAV